MAEMFSMMDVCKNDGPRNRRVQILKNVSLSIAGREIVGIIDSHPRTSTALLHMAAGWTSPDSGHIRVNGIDVTRLSRRKRESLSRRHILWVDRQSPSPEIEWTVHRHLYWCAFASHTCLPRGTRAKHA